MAADYAPPMKFHTYRLAEPSYRADNVKLVINSSPGRINSAEICQFFGTRCGGFEAGASRGYLIVNLTNAGYLNASYTLTVSSS